MTMAIVMGYMSALFQMLRLLIYAIGQHTIPFFSDSKRLFFGNHFGFCICDALIVNVTL